MLRYALKRILLSATLLLLVALLLYVVLRLLPTSYVEGMAQQRASQLGTDKSYLQWLSQLNAVYGLDQGVLRGFAQWLGQAVQGNFGLSWYYQQPVLSVFSRVIVCSVALCLASYALELALALPLGLWAAGRRYSPADHGLTLLALLSLSLPVFFIAALLKLVFAVQLNWLPLFGAVSRDLGAGGWEQLRHYVLPLLTLTLANCGALLRFIRGAASEAQQADHLRAARARGLSQSQLRGHVVRNILLPLITLAGASLPGLFAGALVVEVLFQIPGIGWTAYQAMIAGDIPFSMFYLLLLAAATLLGSLLADLLYAVADPRVRRPERGRADG